MTEKTKPIACPSCNVELDAVTGVTDGATLPKAGDITVCFYCYGVLEYTEDMKLAEVDINTLQPEVRDIVAMTVVEIAKMHGQRTLH